MPELDIDRCLEVLTELVRAEGGIVFRNEWDSGGPGAGADVELVHCYQGLYWPEDSTCGFSGPFDSLQEALKAGPGAVTSATTGIECADIPTPKLVKLLWVQSVPEGPFEINGEAWKVTAKGKLTRVK